MAPGRSTTIRSKQSCRPVLMSRTGVTVLSVSDLATLPQPVGQAVARAAAAGTAAVASIAPASANVAQIVLI